MIADYKTVVLDGEIDLDLALDGDIDLDLVQDGECEIVTEVIKSDYDFYSGPTEVTPSNETQTLETQDKVVLSNIVVNPIPSNYGLITWNGVALTVS